MKKKVNKQKKIFSIVVAVLLLAAVLGGGGYALLRKSEPVDKISLSIESHNMDDMDMTEHMNSSVDALKGLKGDQFDEAFLIAMAEHHAGAIEMAEFAIEKGKHQEVQTLGANIQKDQQKEIDDMRSWASQWGYKFNEPSDSAVQMMSESLKGMTGDELDKQFLTDMSIHHNGAIEMAQLTLSNAKHQELKDFANKIIAAQAQEMMDMNTWAISWGYQLEENKNNPHASE